MRRIPLEEEDDIDLDLWQEEADTDAAARELLLTWRRADHAFYNARNKLRSASEYYDNSERYNYYGKEAELSARVQAGYEAYFDTEEALKLARANFFECIEGMRNHKKK